MMKTLLLPFLFFGPMACTTPSFQNSRSPDAKVYVLGTIHSNMLDQPNNSLRDFAKAIALFQPDLILTEVRPEHPGAIEGSIDGGSEQALVYAFAKHTHSKIMGVDWFDDGQILLAAEEDSKLSPTLKAQIEPLFEKFRKVVQTGTFVESQSSATQELIRQRYQSLTKAGFTASDIRNNAICKNIRSHQAELDGKRVLVVFGIAHKYILEDCFKRSGIQPLSLQAWYAPDRANSLVINEAVKNESIATLSSAKSLLQQRLKQGYYKTDLENLQEKLAEFDLWIEKTKAL